MKIQLSMAIALGLIAAPAALGQDVYLSGQIGVRAVEQFDGDLTGADIDGELGNGVYSAGAVGLDRGAWRFEAEIANRAGSLNALNINGVDTGATGDGLAATSLMANAYYDFANESRVTPYLGAGLGLARITADMSGPGGAIDGDTTVLAVQLIGGASLAVSDSVSVFTDLRYFRAGEADFTMTAPLGSSNVSFDYDGYTLGAGLRVAF